MCKAVAPGGQFAERKQQYLHLHPTVHPSCFFPVDQQACFRILTERQWFAPNSVTFQPGWHAGGSSLVSSHRICAPLPGAPQELFPSPSYLQVSHLLLFTHSHRFHMFLLMLLYQLLEKRKCQTAQMRLEGGGAGREAQVPLLRRCSSKGLGI